MSTFKVGGYVKIKPLDDVKDSLCASDFADYYSMITNSYVALQYTLQYEIVEIREGVTYPLIISVDGSKLLFTENEVISIPAYSLGGIYER